MRGTGMRLLAVHGDRVLASRPVGGHDPDGRAFGFEDRALLDVDLGVGDGLGRSAVAVETDIGQGVSDADAGAVGGLQDVLGVELADEDPASHQAG